MLDCKYLIIGSGETGLILAKNLAKNGAKIILAEEAEIGGSYLNSFDYPKHLASQKSSDFFSALKLFKNNPETFSILTKYRQKLYLEMQTQIKEKQNEIINDLEKTGNVQIIKGRLEFVSKTLAEINSAEERHLIGFEQALLAIGKNSMLKPEIGGLEDVDFLFRHNVFSMTKIPSKLAIIGCTQENIEVASIFSGIGVKVEVFERKSAQKIFPKLDKSLFNYLLKSLSKRNVTFFFETEIKKIEKDKKEPTLVDQNLKNYSCSDIYFEIKETFGSDLVGLKKVDLKWVKEGVVSNELGKTVHPHIWAFGECSSGSNDKNKYASIYNFIQKQNPDPQNKKTLPLTILNSYFGEVEVSPINLRTIRINTEIKSSNPISNIGLSEQNAQAVYGNHIKCEIITNNFLEGFLKIVYRENNDQVLGFMLAGDFCLRLEDYAVVSLRKNVNYRQVKSFLEAYRGW